MLFFVEFMGLTGAENRLSRSGMNISQTEKLPKTHPAELTRALNQITITNALAEARSRAFRTYVKLVPPEFIESNETNADHGWSHIRRVGLIAQDNIMKSVESVSRPDAVERMAPALELAIRFHDIIQQHTLSKYFHREIGALFLMLLAPELKQLGYSHEDIYAAAVMVFYHSDTENIHTNIAMPDFASLKVLIENQLRTLGNQAPSQTLTDYLPVFNGLSDFEYDRRLANGDHFPEPELSLSQKQEIVFFTCRLATADKIDTLGSPGNSLPAVLRTLQSRPQRALLSEFNEPLAMQSIAHRTADIARFMDNPTIDHNPHLRQYFLDQLIWLQDLEDMLANMFSEGMEIPLDLELETRLVGGGLASSPDDLSRFLFEGLGRDYEKLRPTSYEKVKISQMLKTRIKTVADLISSLLRDDASLVEADYQRRLEKLDKSGSGAGAENTSMYQRVLDEREATIRILKFKRQKLRTELKFLGGDERKLLERVQELCNRAMDKIEFLAAPQDRVLTTFGFDPPTSMETAQKRIQTQTSAVM